MKGKVFCNFNIYKIFSCFVLTIELYMYLYINYQTNLIWKRSVLVHDKLSFIEVVVISMRNEIEIQYIIVKKNYETKFDTAVYLK